MRRTLGLLVVVSTTFPACTLVGYPSGRAPNVELPPPGPIRTGGDASPPRDVDRRPTAAPAEEPDPEAVLDASVRPLRTEPERTDNGRTYEVFGVRYHVLDSAVGYDAEGVASWYGEQFNGRPTASGEIFDMNGYSAAHRTLPLHTWVEVENLDNGRRIVVKVNDRGPFVDTSDRLIDVSLGAARRLDMVGAGLARVRIRAVEPPEG